MLIRKQDPLKKIEQNKANREGKTALNTKSCCREEGNNQFFVFCLHSNHIMESGQIVKNLIKAFQSIISKTNCLRREKSPSLLIFIRRLENHCSAMTDIHLTWSEAEDCPRWLVKGHSRPVTLYQLQMPASSPFSAVELLGISGTNVILYDFNSLQHWMNFWLKMTHFSCTSWIRF